MQEFQVLSEISFMSKKIFENYIIQENWVNSLAEKFEKKTFLQKKVCWFSSIGYSERVPGDKKPRKQ